MPEPTAPLTEFIRAYEQATNSHDITQLVPLIAPDAVYWFSDGSYRGREAILSAIAKTFATIRDEIYQIDDLEWIAHSDDHAVCRYRFTWTGTIDSQPRSGSGRGTNVLGYPTDPPRIRVLFPADTASAVRTLVNPSRPRAKRPRRTRRKTPRTCRRSSNWSSSAASSASSRPRSPGGIRDLRSPIGRSRTWLRPPCL
ncbi:nuclear transport factor 2 family protein [Streptomyces sp. NBC_01717]|uniref:YybH family protein n=1 Tax=Streptomyces sp. NBC_01717 TaxID=2975918 RepID=UPI002E3118C0|nr:nuclear transport factor 2 family protein [Streptomyces sp. NBC_01717]